jgi:addiction module HigA family antidote
MAEYKAGPRRRRPTHPGAILKANLAAIGLTAYAAGPLLGVTKQALQNIIDEKSAISAEMALRLGKFFGDGPDLWINMQTDIDLWDAKQKIGAEVRKIKQAWDPSQIPTED